MANQTELSPEKKKALESAMHQITKEFGAGSIMRLGDMGDKLDIDVIPTGSLALDIAVGDTPEAGSLKSMVLNHPVKRPWLFMPLRKPRNWVAWQPSSMRNTPWTPCMLIIWA